MSSQVIQYDFGKATLGSQFQRTSILTRPLQILLNAIATLQARHNRSQNQIPAIINRMLQRYPGLVNYQRPRSSDILYKYNYNHVQSSPGTCNTCQKQHIQSQQDQLHQNPIIHHGKIASANQVMMDSKIRRRIAKDLEVDYFEIESARLMDNSISCLVIQGICDYSDSHKNKD